MQQHNIELPDEARVSLAALVSRMHEKQAEGGVSFPEMVRNLFKDMDTPAASLHHAATGIAGEGGEILDVSKKTWVYGKPLDAQNLIEELSDLQFYIQVILNQLGLTLEHVIAYNMNKLVFGENARFPDGAYSDVAAIARADKVAEGETQSSGVAAE